jgi:hypothetical protein
MFSNTAHEVRRTRFNDAVSFWFHHHYNVLFYIFYLDDYMFRSLDHLQVTFTKLRIKGIICTAITFW